MKHPVVLMVYNRTYHLLKVLEALRKYGEQIEIFYIFCDGAKDPQESGVVNRVREIVQNIDWISRIVVKHEVHLGLARSLIFATDYVLNRHSSIILLEDDCVVGPYFFKFMERCLALYRNEGKVLSISGYTVPIPKILRDDYHYDLYFFPRFGSWGWATWESRWRFYEHDLKTGYNRAKKLGVEFGVGGKDVESIIRRTVRGELDAWSPGWLLGGLVNDLYTVYPTVSHVQNIGHDGSGVHCGKSDRFNTPMGKKIPFRFPTSAFVDSALSNNFREYYR